MSFRGTIICGLLLLCAYHTESKPTKHLLDPKVSALHLGLLGPMSSQKLHGANATTCMHPSAVESFAASFYTSFIVTHDPVIVKRLEIPSEETAKKLYPLIQKILSDDRECNADFIAHQVAKSFGVAGSLQLADHFKQAAYGVGELLYLAGTLDCQNAITMAFEFFDFVKEAFGENDNYESYMRGMVYGLSDFLIAHKDVLKELTLELAVSFYKEYSDGNNGSCDSAPVSASGREL